MKTQFQARRSRNRESATPSTIHDIGLLRRRFSAGKDAPVNDLEELLLSAILASDKNLSHIVREVDEMVKLPFSQTSEDAGENRSAVYSAVKHMIVERELRHLALTDDLTCLYNRRGFFAAATHQLKLARRNGRRMLLLFCDVDRLKEINDSYGHREGDRALVRVADALEKAFRDSDILARLGGDEFAVLALEATDRNLETITNRLRKALGQSKEDCPYELTLSVGFARFDPAHPAALGELISEADRVMYQSKRNRRSVSDGKSFGAVKAAKALSPKGLHARELA